METTVTFKVTPLERTPEAILHLARVLEGRYATAWLERDHIALTLDTDGGAEAARRNHAKKLITDALAQIGLEPLDLGA